MTYSITWEVDPGVFFRIDSSTVKELATEVDKLGGSFAELKDRIKSVLSGETPTPSAELGAAIREAARSDEPPTTDSAVPSASAEGGPANADPWAAVERAAEDDPWGEPADPTETQSASSEKSSQKPASSLNVIRDSFGREWTLNLPDAPMCECGQPAAKMKAKAKSSGKRYTKWRCAKAAGDDWNKKCDFDEWPK